MRVNVKSVTGFVDRGLLIPVRVKVSAVAPVPPAYCEVKPEFAVSVVPEIAQEIELVNPAVLVQLVAVEPASII